MKLVKLTSNKPSFKTVKFNETGLSLILGKKTTQSESEDKDSSKTINGIGKTLSSYLIGYCLGANKNESFEKELSGWSFKLEFIVNGKNFTAERVVNDQDNIIINGKIYSLYDAGAYYRELFFTESVGIKNLGFRPLYKRFVRTDKVAYTSYDKADLHEYSDTKLIRNGYLLGLDLDLITTKVDLKVKLDDLNNTKNKLQGDELIQKFISEENSIKKSKEELLWEKQRLSNQISEYRIAENYADIEAQSKILYRELVDLKNQKFSIESDINGINETLKINPDLDHRSIKSMYDELNTKFNEEISKSIADVSNFYNKLRERRQKRLFQRKKEVLDNKETVEKEIEQLQGEYDKLIKYLDTHGALDEFHELKEYEKSIQRDLNKLDSYKTLISQVEKKINEIKESFITQDQLTNDYLESYSEELGQIKLLFVEYIKSIYPDKSCGLKIENNSGINKTRFDIEAYIHSDSSDGINEVLIFCYDLLLLSIKKRHKFDFLYHDSRLFSDVDPRQRARMFKLANKISTEQDKQYIASINEDQLETIKDYFEDDDEYQKIIENNIVLTLKDDSPESKILGIDVELEY